MTAPYNRGHGAPSRYRRGMAVDKALAIIEENLGSQFDRALGERFVRLGRAGRLDHVVGHSEAGIPLQECPMCGPTIVVCHDQRSGDHVYCRHCGGEARVEHDGDTIHATPTGRKGTPEDLQPDVDAALIDSLVRETARFIAAVGVPASS